MGYDSQKSEIFYRDMLVEDKLTMIIHMTVFEWYFDENGVVRFYVTLYG